MDKEYDIAILRPYTINKPGAILMCLIIGIPMSQPLWTKESLEYMKNIVLIREIFTGTMDVVQILSLIAALLPIIMIIVGLSIIAVIVHQYLKATKRAERIEFLTMQGWKMTGAVSDVKIGVDFSSKTRHNGLLIKVTVPVNGVDKEFISDLLKAVKFKQMPDGDNVVQMNLTVGDLGLPEKFDVYVNPDNMNEYYVDTRPILTPPRKRIIG